MKRKFLYELLETASVSGFEEEIQRKIIKYARGFADEIYTDEIADVVSIVNPDAEIKIMLSAHMDEIGLMVSHITEKGMLHVSKAGGIYPGTYLGQKVRIMHEGNVVYGAVRNHGSLNKKELEITDIIIDIGAVSREDAMAHVACGDSVSFDTDYRELLNDRLCARGLDDRLGGYIILEAAKKAKERGCTCGIYAATTVGEELTKHGAARNVHIKYQWEDGCGRTCTDADAIHMAGRGIPTTVMSIPFRYMHNPAEVCSMEDVQGCIDVLAEFLCGIGSDICLKPLKG